MLELQPEKIVRCPLADQTVVAHDTTQTGERMCSVDELVRPVGADSRDTRSQQASRGSETIQAPDDTRTPPRLGVKHLLFTLAALDEVNVPRSMEVHVLQNAAQQLPARLDRSRQQQGNLRYPRPYHMHGGFIP
jgi:hypothetical protein